MTKKPIKTILKKGGSPKGSEKTPAATTAERVVRMVPVADLVPYDRNPKKHPQEKVVELVANILKFGWTNPILAEGVKVVAGHGRLLAAKMIYEQDGSLALPDGSPIPVGTVPVLDCTGWDEAKRRAYIIWDNKSTEGDWDFVLLRDELLALDTGGFDMTLTGFSEQEREQMAGWTPDREDGGGGAGNEYSAKIETPIYTPKGEKPPVSALCSEERSGALAERIRAAKGISKEERDFLLKAANRHTVFDYHAAAEYYAHASHEMQALMEDSALVIIDFNKAIERGYVKWRNTVPCILREEHKKARRGGTYGGGEE